MSASNSYSSTFETLRIHAFLPYSRANGPGLRAVIWLQGCTLNCPGCFNPATHPANEGQFVTTTGLLGQLSGLLGKIEGVTFSGGEPLQQPRPLLALLRRLRTETELSLLLFTGYSLAEVRARSWGKALLSQVDVLVAGRYDITAPLPTGWPMTPGKTTHYLTQRYTPAAMKDIPSLEAVISPSGAVAFSGIAGPPPD